MRFGHLIRVFLILLMSFQLSLAHAFVQISRYPAGWGHDIQLGPLKKKISNFKIKILGEEIEADCAKDGEMKPLDGDVDYLEMDENEDVARKQEYYLDNLIKNVEVESSGRYVYTWDKEKENKEEECKPRKIRGLLDKTVDKTMQEEAQEKRPTPFRLDDPEVRALHQEAEFILGEVRKYLVDNQLKEDERQELLLSYLESVAVPMRDLIVVKRAYIPHEYNGTFFYESLLPEFPTRLFPADDIEARQKLMLGPNPSAGQLHLQVIDGRWGRSKLRYDRNSIIQRDILTLLKAPTVLNYVRAMKWMTLHMMLSQVYLYDSMLDNKNPVQIPNACQNHFNGDLPGKFKFEFQEGQGEEYVDNMLANHSLIFSYDNYQFMEYYKDNVSKDPTKDGYSGLVPFEQYKFSKIGVKGEKRPFLKPEIDDFTYFDMVKEIKGAEIKELYHGSTSSLLGMRTSRNYTYIGEEVIKKILEVPGEYQSYTYKSKEGEEEIIDPSIQNLSTFLAEMMQRHGIGHFEGLITDELRTRYNKNRILIDFPSLHGSALWRQWALTNLATYAAEKSLDPVEQRTALNTAVKNSCAYEIHRSGGELERICGTREKMNDSQTILKNVATYLEDFITNSEYIPTRRLYEREIESIYPFLGMLWTNLRTHMDDFTVAKPKEMDYLVEQMKAYNPWARLRFSYIMALDELETYMAGNSPRYGAGKTHEQYRRSLQVYRNINSTLRKLKAAGKILGIHKAIAPNHASRLLDDDEKEYLWQNYMDEINEGTSRLFVQKSHVNKDDPKEYYDFIENISYKTLLTREHVDTLESSLPRGIRPESKKAIEDTLNSELGKLGNFFYDLYTTKDLEKQKQMFEDFSAEHGIDNAFTVKMNFLMLDNDLKRPIYKSLVKEAAHYRKLDVLANLEEFCNMEPDNHEKLQTLFYATTKAQNQINKLAGKPVVPDEIMQKINDKINSMSPDEWTDMWLGIGAGVLGVAAILIGGACTGITGGLCAPLGVTMMAAGASAVGMQVALVKREFDRKKNANVYQRQVKDMEELGLTNLGGSEAVSRSWFWTAFETVSIIPLIGVFARSVKVGSKLAYVGTRMMAQNWFVPMLLRQSGRMGLKEAWKLTGQAGKVVVSEADVAFARMVLGLDKGVEHALFDAARATSETVGRVTAKGFSKEAFSQAVDEVKKLQFLFKSGRISANTMASRIGQVVDGFKEIAKAGLRTNADGVLEYASKVVVKETPEVIDNAAAKTVATYFGHNPKAMKRLIESYAEKLEKAIRIMDKINKGQTLAGKIPVAGKIFNWFRKMRLEHLAKNADKIRRIEKGLAHWSRTGKDLDQFVLHYMDDLTDIFVDIPMRWRELPYMIFLQGGPHIGGPLAGRRIGYVSQMADGLIMRKFFNARSRLIYEAVKGKARTVLGMSAKVGAETTYQAYQAFQTSIESALEGATESQAKKMVRQVKLLEARMTEKIYKAAEHTLKSTDVLSRLKRNIFRGQTKLLAETAQLDRAALKKVLFNPGNDQERALGQVLWENVNAEDLLELREVGEVAHRVIRELSQYKDVDQFQGFVNALKVLALHRDPGVVEIM